MADLSREKTVMAEQRPEIRNKNFNEVALGYTPEEAKREAQRCLNCKDAPCVSMCPVGVPIPRFIDEIKKGNLKESFEYLSGANDLPAICGRVCPQETQCESSCVRGRNGEPVAIGRLERFVADYAGENNMSALEKPGWNGHRVAVIGSGPAGLTCAGELARMGYSVTVFESLHMPGGVLSYGIPEFRLPKAIVGRELGRLKELGVNFEMNMVVGKTISIDEMFEEGFEAVFIGTGSGLPRFLKIPGEDLTGIYSANEYLTRINLMKANLEGSETPVLKSRNAVVFGGGNVAMDSARCAKRMGAESVYIIYRRTEAELPARLEEVIHAKEEGIDFRMLSAPLEFYGDENGRVKGVRLQKMRLGELDSSGRRSFVPIEGSEYVIETDCAIVAIGTSPNPLLKSETPGLEVDRRGCIITSAEGKTSMERVYAGGDASTGAATVILAMGAGKTAARTIDKDIMGADQAVKQNIFR